MSHDSLVLNKRNSALVLEQRKTPQPGPREVLIRVEAIALNPVDHIQQSSGYNITKYPAVLGYDVAGTIHEVGASVSEFAVGDRVIALAAIWFIKSADYGGFQKIVLVPVEEVTRIPSFLPFNEAAVLPLAVYTAWYSFLHLEVERDKVFSESDKKGILIWGVSGSVGSVTLQIAKTLGFHIYATASSKHHSYLSGLGNGPGKLTLFDYNDKEVVKKIVNAAREDGVFIDLAIESAAGNLRDIVSIVKQTKSPTTRFPRISAAPFSLSLLWYTLLPSVISRVIIKFVSGPADANSRVKDFSFIYNTWLSEKLNNRSIVPSPKVKVYPEGFQGIEKGFSELKNGVSGIKIVVEV